MGGVRGRPSVLVVCRETACHQAFRDVFPRGECDLIHASDPSALLGAFHSRAADLVVLATDADRGRDDVAVIRQLRRHDPRFPIILVVAESTEDFAIGALRAGVSDYFRLPYSAQDLLASARRLLEATAPHSAPPRNGEARPPLRGADMIGQSPPMQKLRRFIERVSATDSNVLLVGETGTGKELAAQWIHQASPRRRCPLVSINCAAIPDSLFESELFGHEKGAFTGAHAAHNGKLRSADGGTVFLDEIGDLSPFGQAKILRAIETKEVFPVGGRGRVPLNIRIVAATNQNLERLVEEGKFRKDLYFRLNVTEISLPALRDRKEDIPDLLRHYIRDYNRRFGHDVQGLDPDVEACLLRYDWPGNIRELKNVIEAIYVNLPMGRISLLDLPERLQQHLRHLERIPQTERDQLLSALLSVNWNKSRAAEKLQWSRMTLYRKLAKYDLGIPKRAEH